MEATKELAWISPTFWKSVRNPLLLQQVAAEVSTRCWGTSLKASPERRRRKSPKSKPKGRFSRTKCEKSGLVVVILPRFKNTVLLQLRDEKPDIAFPGCWGFFGGSVNNGESPEDAARRELFEELGLNASTLYDLGEEIIWDIGNVRSRAYTYDLETPITSIVQGEGMDMDLCTHEQVLAKSIFSKKFGRDFPVVPSYYIEKMVTLSLANRTTHKKMS